MKRFLLAFILLPLWSQAQTVNTIAGSGTPAYSGDGGAASAANVNGACQVITDASGNVFIADYRNNVVRKIDASGYISTFAGTGTPGFSGDGSAATAATLNWPTGIFIDAGGNMLIADYGNNRIRKVSTSGTITTIAGTGATGHTGDAGPATAATFNLPQAVCTDQAGNIYVADGNNNAIRKINPAGIISNFAGTAVLGYSGDGGPATAAQIANPFGIISDPVGNLYIADQNNNRIRKVNALGVISTVAGTGLRAYGGDGGAATAAYLNTPAAVFFNAADTSLYIADQLNGAIRKINASGTITNIGGTGVMGYGGDGGSPLLANFNSPSGLWINGSGDIYIADQLNNRVREISFCKSVVITSQPRNVTVSGGSDAKFFVTLTLSFLGHQWQEDRGAGYVNLSEVAPYSGTHSDTLTITGTPSYLKGARYRCVLSDENIRCTGYSDGATLSIKAPGTDPLATTDLHAASISVFPNPADNAVLITGSSDINSIQLTNALGQLIVNKTINARSGNIDLSMLPSGIYLLRADVNGQPVYKKVVKN